MLLKKGFTPPSKKKKGSTSQMAIGFFAFLLSISLLLRCLASQQPNTDVFFVKEFFQKTRGEHSPHPSINGEVCSWKGVVTCDAQMEKVVSIVAPGFGLSGPIPETTIAKLSKLQHLDLSDNDITGFPSDFWELGSSLKSLNLSSNKIKGALPGNVGNFGPMEILDLSHNELSGEIPETVGSLSSLRVLNLCGNLFKGNIPDAIIVGCSSLTSLDLSRNRLSGNVPDGLGTSLKNLSYLDISSNSITGKLPDLSGLNSITYLNLSGNMFQGSVIGVLRNPLEIIDLSRNQLQGHIPQVNLSSSSSSSSLVYLDLSMNELSGEFFAGFVVRAGMLKYLNLAFNLFSRHEFPQIELFHGLEYLNLSRTNLVGGIPSEISKLVSLRTLDLSMNHLNGSIPELGTNNLQVLDLSSNNLSGKVHLSLQNKLNSMKKFNFSYNNLSLCTSQFAPQVIDAIFIGSQNDCPIAADPEIIEAKRGKHKGLKLGLALAFSFFFLIAGLVCLAFMHQRRTKSWAVKQMSYKEEQSVSGPFSFQTDSTTWVADVKLATSVPVVIFEKPLLSFTFADLLAATSHFDRGTLLAEGRFGPVYRGILPGGIHVAIKVLVHGSTITDEEAAKELERLGGIKHPNLVPLTGYCLAGDQRISIYEYMEYGNLQNLLHDLPLGVQITEDWSADTWEENNASGQNITTEGMTTWRFRHKIALGAARALAFLHHGCFPQIVHRDVKASSIYLDSALEPRLSDFGLSHIVCTSLEDEVSRGSVGYGPPEFYDAENADSTTKSDVYGYGVVLFELITGKRPIGDEYPGVKESTLVNWARAMVKKNEGSKLIDPQIADTAPLKQIEEALRIAYLCTADLPSKRPSMQQIVGLLKDIEPANGDH